MHNLRWKEIFNMYGLKFMRECCSGLNGWGEASATIQASQVLNL